MRLVSILVVALAATTTAFSLADITEYGNHALAAFKRALLSRHHWLH
jgi:hypothetical protein